MRFLVGLFALAATPVAAHDLPVRLADGATWEMTVVRERRTDRDGAARSTSTETATQLVWRKDELTVKPVSSFAVVDGKRLSLPTLGVPVVLAVDDALTPESIRNEAEVRKAFEALIDRVAPDSKAPGGFREAIPGLMDTSMTAMATTDLTWTSIGQGVSLELGKPVAYEDALPNPLGGSPITSKASFTLESYDEAGGRAVVSWRQTLDPQSAQASMAAALTALTAKLAPDKVEDARTAYAKMKMERLDTCRHEVDLATGLAVKAVCTSETLIGADGKAARNSDRWTITQTLPKTEAAR